MIINREISRMESSMNRDASGTKNISSFISHLSELLTDELKASVSLLIPLLANEVITSTQIIIL
jgi:hypothetical protein